jgi:hypothetical protein
LRHCHCESAFALCATADKPQTANREPRILMR